MNYTEGSYILYYGLNGYGITLFYVGINILMFLVASVAVVLNGVILYILLGRDFREDVSCIFISHQSLSDLLSSVLLFYNVLYNLIHYKVYYECAVRFGLVNGVFMNSSVVLLALTAERYAKIILPYKYASIVTPVRAKIFMLSSWFISVIFCQSPLFGWNRDTSEEYCRYFGVFTEGFLLTYCSILVSIFCLVFMMYCHILIIAFKQSKKIYRFEQTKVNQWHKHIWWRPTKTALIIVGVNVLCWLPSGLVILLSANDDLLTLSMGQQGTILTYVSSIIYLNCIINPMIYAFNIKKVSRVVRKMMKLPEQKSFVTEYRLKQVNDLLLGMNEEQ